MKEKHQLELSLNTYKELQQSFESYLELLNLSIIEQDYELEKECQIQLKQIEALANKSEIECLFTGESDINDSFLEIHAGAGGTESHDWTEMLLRMYCRWAESRKFKVEIIDKISGEEAGIKSVTIKISGLRAYGWCKTENGIHRLVRISPFNAAGKRQTSFASVFAFPVVDDSINIDIIEKDLRIDTYRSSGAGGQHVNTTDSAVRITHLPTGIVVQCQNERSQHKNKSSALSMLKARLYERERRIKEEKLQTINSEKTDIGWGHQIRSYVLEPYRMVKDLRTEYKTYDTEAVLDGDLDEFMISYLKFMITNPKA
jgi:peptide chain release factor 2